ncbi:hypothetical protein ACFW6N_32125 [Streptomyces cyaneofuscatus]|uniref:hypothetical protein n=1 Tax=Streptomyces cyaneofuscatus TaxID=66883 RepID=UPI0036A06D46
MTAVSPGLARQAYEQAQQLAAEAHDPTETVTEPAVQPQPGDTGEDGARERAERERRLAESQRQREMAAVPPWKSRPYGKRSDAGLVRAIGVAQEAGTLAEHSARRTAEEARLLEERLAQEKAAGQTRGQAVAASEPVFKPSVRCRGPC